MHRYGSSRTVTTTATPEEISERRIRRLRLTLHPTDTGQNETKRINSEAETMVNGTLRKKNGYIQRERPAGRESPVQHLSTETNGVRGKLPQQGPTLNGVVQRTDTEREQEVMAREWSVSHLKDEMNYIREVRDSLEKVRERMYGQFGGMQQSMQKLSQDIQSATLQKRSLEAEVKVRTAALDSVDQMNSSLISANIELQKSLLESCSNRVESREELKSLRLAREQAEERLRERDRELATAHAENHTLKLQVASSQEANSQTLQEISEKLQRQYELRLQEEHRKHREEIENLQTQIDEYIRLLEEAVRKERIAEEKIAERDRRIMEVERLLDCMAQEKSQLGQKLRDCEMRLRRSKQTDQVDAASARRSQQLAEEAKELRERIRHLNDMVFCQQRKVKAMIEEVETLKAKLAQKDVFIAELLDRIAIVECENNELEDKLKYFMSVQSGSHDVVHTRDVGVGCDLLPRPEMQQDNRQVESNPVKSGPPPPSRLQSSLLKYTPTQYSMLLQSDWTKTSGTTSSSTQSTSGPLNAVPSSPLESTSVQSTASSDESTSVSPYHQTRPNPARSRIYTPFMRLMEITAKINIE